MTWVTVGREEGESGSSPSRRVGESFAIMAAKPVCVFRGALSVCLGARFVNNKRQCVMEWGVMFH